MSEGGTRDFWGIRKKCLKCDLKGVDCLLGKITQTGGIFLPFDASFSLRRVATHAFSHQMVHSLSCLRVQGKLVGGWMPLQSAQIR